MTNFASIIQNEIDVIEQQMTSDKDYLKFLESEHKRITDRIDTSPEYLANLKKIQYHHGATEKVEFSEGSKRKYSRGTSVAWTQEEKNYVWSQYRKGVSVKDIKRLIKEQFNTDRTLAAVNAKIQERKQKEDESKLAFAA